MKAYKTKSKLLGYQIGLNNDHVYVAVPKKYMANGCLSVTCQGETKTFLETDKEQEATLKDKYKTGANYTLYYFKWEN